jgi:hypothetical protein
MGGGFSPWRWLVLSCEAYHRRQGCSEGGGCSGHHSHALSSCKSKAALFFRTEPGVSSHQSPRAGNIGAPSFLSALENIPLVE